MGMIALIVMVYGYCAWLGLPWLVYGLAWWIFGIEVAGWHFWSLFVASGPWVMVWGRSFEDLVWLVRRRLYRDEWP